MKSSSQPYLHRLPCLAALAGLLMLGSLTAFADGSIVINGRVQPQLARSMARQPAGSETISTGADRGPHAAAVADLFEAVMANEFGETGGTVAFQIDSSAETVTFAHPVDGARQVLTFADLRLLSGARD